MSTVTATDVEEILDTSLDLDAIEFWVETAEDIYDDLDTTDLQVDEDRLVRIMSAHLCSIQDPRLAGGGIAGESVSYQGRTDMYWEATQYGQAAVSLAPQLTERQSQFFDADDDFFTF